MASERIQTAPSTKRVLVRAGEVDLAASSDAVELKETGYPDRYYLPRTDVHTELLERSDTRTRCPYKGEATHWTLRTLDGESIADVAWSYEGEDCIDDVAAIRDRICFYANRVEVTVDGTRQEH